MNYLEDLFSLKGKNVVITGGGGVIAEAMSKAILGAGGNIALWGKTKESIEIAKNKLEEQTDNTICAIKVDTFKEDDIKKAIVETSNVIGKPNVLINAVGGNRGKSPFIETDMETFEFVLKLNLIAGLMVPTKVITSFWIDEEIKGIVINLTSMASYIPLSGVWAYNAAKSGVKNLTMAAAKEFAPYGIRVNAIAPGFFVGKQNKTLLIKNEETGELTDRGKSIIERTPFKRFGKIEELTGATIFLISDNASGFVTGVSLPIDGGYLVDNI